LVRSDIQRRRIRQLLAHGIIHVAESARINGSLIGDRYGLGRLLTIEHTHQTLGYSPVNRTDPMAQT
jgi:hypothetical protein